MILDQLCMAKISYVLLSLIVENEITHFNIYSANQIVEQNLRLFVIVYQFLPPRGSDSTDLSVDIIWSRIPSARTRKYRI